MTRDHEEQLLAFSAAQRLRFCEEDWVQLAATGSVSTEEVAATALFLAGGYWYGRHEELFRVADRLVPGSVGKFSEQAKAVEFNCSRFDHMLKTRAYSLESRNT